MIHIKETEIIPLLKEAQTEYSQKITEGDPKDVEMAERIEITYPVATPQQPSSRRQVGTGWCEIWSTAKQKKITGRR